MSLYFISSNGTILSKLERNLALLNCAKHKLREPVMIMKPGSWSFGGPYLQQRPAIWNCEQIWISASFLILKGSKDLEVGNMSMCCNSQGCRERIFNLQYMQEMRLNTWMPIARWCDLTPRHTRNLDTACRSQWYTTAHTHWTQILNGRRIDVKK